MFAVARRNIITADYQRLDREWQPKLAAHADAIAFTPGLFARIEDVYNSLPANLDANQVRLVTRVYEDSVRRGANLGDAGKARLSEINQELAALFAEFRAKVLAAEDTWTVLDSEDDLVGLPPSLIETARATADQRGLAHRWAIANTQSSAGPFLYVLRAP